MNFKMRHNYQRKGVTENYIYAAVADAILNDIKINGVSYKGFPDIRLEDKGSEFYLTLMNNGVTTDPLVISEKEAFSYAKTFHNRKPVPHELLIKVQDLLADMEMKTSTHSAGD